MNEIERAIESAQARLNLMETNLSNSRGDEATLAKRRRQVETAKITLIALQEKAEREKGCVWCKEDNKVFHDGQRFHMFCSYCGKRLEVEP